MKMALLIAAALVAAMVVSAPKCIAAGATTQSSRPVTTKEDQSLCALFRLLESTNTTVEQFNPVLTALTGHNLDEVFDTLKQVKGVKVTWFELRKGKKETPQGKEMNKSGVKKRVVYEEVTESVIRKRVDEGIYKLYKLRLKGSLADMPPWIKGLLPALSKYAAGRRFVIFPLHLRAWPDNVTYIAMAMRKVRLSLSPDGRFTIESDIFQPFGVGNRMPALVQRSPYEQQNGPMDEEQAPVLSPVPVAISCPLPAIDKTLLMNGTGNKIQPQAMPNNATLKSCTWEELLDNGSSVPATNIIPLPINSDPAGLDNATGWIDLAYVDNVSVMASKPYQVRMELKGPAGMQNIPSSYPAWLRTLYANKVSKMQVMVYIDEVIHNPSNTTVRCHTQPIVVIDSRSCWTMGYFGKGASQRAVITLYCGDPIGNLDLEPWTPASSNP